jgi:adenine-specific DNA methylase
MKTSFSETKLQPLLEANHTSDT